MSDALQFIDTPESFNDAILQEECYAEICAAMESIDLELTPAVITLESAGSVLKSLWASIVRIFRRIWASILDFFTAFKRSNIIIKSKVETIRKAVSDSANKTYTPAALEMGTSWFNTYRRSDADRASMVVEVLAVQDKLLEAFLVRYSARVNTVCTQLTQVVESNALGLTDYKALTVALGPIIQTAANDFYDQMHTQPATRDPRFNTTDFYKSYEIGGRKAILLKSPINVSDPNGGIIDYLSDTTANKEKWLSAVQSMRYSLIPYDAAPRAPTPKVMVNSFTIKEIVAICDSALKLLDRMSEYNGNQLSKTQSNLARLEKACGRMALKTDEGGAVNRRVLMFVPTVSYWGTSIQTAICKHSTGVIRAAMLGCAASLSCYQ